MLLLFCSYDQTIECALKNSIIKYHPSTIDTSDFIFQDVIKYIPLKCSSKWFGYDGYYISRGNCLYVIHIFT